jgi:hypothetical protein
MPVKGLLPTREATAVDVQCSHCGREPSHPQVRYRFAYAAYYQPALSTPLVNARSYVEALCEPCCDADRQAGVGTARNRFLGRALRWSAQPPNRGRVVRLIEHPAGVTGEEREGDSCFRDGAAISYRALVALEQGT